MSKETEPTVTLTFPKARCKDIQIKGMSFVTVDTDMTATEIIMILLQYSSEGGPMMAVRKDA